MKKIAIVLVALFSHTYAVAQEGEARVAGVYKNKEKKADEATGHVPKVHLSLSTGFNNSTGLLGLIFDYNFTDQVAAEVGVGEGSWGLKYDLGFKYFFRKKRLGWALGCGFTYSTGAKEFETSMETINKVNENVTLYLKPQNNLYVSAFKYFNLGRKDNRFFTEIGLSLPVSTDKFIQTAGTQISDRSESIVKFISPGGLMIGMGFCFALDKR